MVEDDIRNLISILQTVICAGVTFRIIIILQKAHVEEEMKSGFLKASKVLKAGAIAICISQVGTVVNSGFQGITEINGIGNAVIKMLNQGSKGLLVFEASMVVVLEIITLIKWQAEDDPSLKARHIKKVIEIVVAGGIIMGVSGVVTVVTGYYT